MRSTSSTSLTVLILLALSHLLNDLMQSVIASSYPVLKEAQGLSFTQIGVIALTFQIAGSLLQPLVGAVIDKRPMPWSMTFAMIFTCAGLIVLALAPNYETILGAVALIGIGSSIFHPEATRATREAAAARQGLGQGIFQLGGQAGAALGPLLAAAIIAQKGQGAIGGFAVLALVAMGLTAWVVRHQSALRATQAKKPPREGPLHDPRAIWTGMIVLTILMASKNAYGESFRSFYTFYLIDRFGLTIAQSQLMLFALLAANAAGAFAGGMIGDRIGRRRVIWLSILGPLPLALILPWMGLAWTGILSVVINFVMASAFAAILIYAMELLPTRVGLVGGLFYGLNFGLGGIAAAFLGMLADHVGLAEVYKLCALLPLAGLLTWFLPPLEPRAA